MLAPALIQRMEGEGNERKFTLSFSSEAPYARYWGVEILDHAPGAVDLNRLNDIGSPVYVAAPPVSPSASSPVIRSCPSSSIPGRGGSSSRDRRWKERRKVWVVR